MPKIDLTSITQLGGGDCFAPLSVLTEARSHLKLADAGGLTDFRANVVRLPPGEWSSEPHWHPDEDEFVFILAGEIMLVEDSGRTVLRTGDAATFAKGVSNAHHLINCSKSDVIFLEISARQPDACIEAGSGCVDDRDGSR